MAIGALLDPFGIYAFFEQTQYWTPFQKIFNLFLFQGILCGIELFGVYYQ
jgi:hypothetical protein